MVLGAGCFGLWNRLDFSVCLEFVKERSNFFELFRVSVVWKKEGSFWVFLGFCFEGLRWGFCSIVYFFAKRGFCSFWIVEDDSCTGFSGKCEKGQNDTIVLFTKIYINLLVFFIVPHFGYLNLEPWVRSNDLD